MQTGRIRWLAFREWQGINTRATRTTTKRWGPCRSSLQLQRGARVGGGIPQRAQGLATIWWLLRVVLMVVAQASSDYFAFRISCQLHSGQDTHLVSGVNQRQWKNQGECSPISCVKNQACNIHIIQMIPHSENPFSIEDTYVEVPQFSEQCGNSRCGQPQTAYEVYQRILLRLQAQEHTRSTEANEYEIRKKFWIASFTGRPLQYQC